MKLQVTQENLNRALNSVARVANSHHTYQFSPMCSLKRRVTALAYQLPTSI